MDYNEARERLRADIAERTGHYVYTHVPIIEYNVDSTLPEIWTLDIVYTDEMGESVAIDILERLTERQRRMRITDLKRKKYYIYSINYAYHT